MASDLTDPDRRRITRRRGACTYCRRKKIRCNGERPCRQCERHGMACSYASSMSAKPARAHSIDSSDQVENVGYEDLLRKTVSQVDPPTSSHHRSVSWLSSELDSMDWFLNLTTPSTTSFDDCSDEALLSPAAVGTQQLTLQRSPIPNIASLDPIDPLLAVAVATRTVPHTPIALEGTDLESSLSRPIDRTSLIETRGLMEEQLSPKTRMPSQLCSMPRTFFTLNQALEEEYQRILFPALSRQDVEAPRQHFDPCVSPLISALATAKVDETSRHAATNAIKSIMSQAYQRSLPASWLAKAPPSINQGVSWDDLPVEQLVGNCFEEPLGVKLYLEQHEVLAVAKSLQADNSGTGSHSDRCIVATLLAWGSLLINGKTTTRTVVLIALTVEACDVLNNEPDSPKKFLAMVAVLQLVHKLGLTHLPRLLSAIMSTIQSLSLHSEAALQSLCGHSNGLSARVKRACWIVFCIDKINTLRCKSFSLFPDSCLQYAPPPRDGCLESQDWLLAQCRYARICGRIHSELCSYRFDRPVTPSGAVKMAAELQEWYESLPDIGHRASPGHHGDHGHHAARLWGLCMLYQYCEATFALLDVEQTISEPARCSGFQQQIISLARKVFGVSHRIEMHDIVYDKILLLLPSLSLCKLVIEVLMHSTSDFGDTRSVLALAHGYFARTVSMLPTHDFFRSVTDLVDIAVKVHKDVI